MASTCLTSRARLRWSGVAESNRAFCVGSAAVRLEQTPRWWADVLAVARGTDNGEQRRPGAAARNRTVPDRVPSDCSRSEEHTSELQSHHDLVCRLLLEKKKKQKKNK